MLTKNHKKYIRNKYKVLLLVAILIFFVWTMFFPFIYTPSALNTEVLSVYKKWVSLARTTDFNWTIILRTSKEAFLITGNDSIFIGKDQSQLLARYFPEVSYGDLEQLLKDTLDNRCCQITKKEDALYFITRKSILQPFCRPGASYSLSGVDISKRNEITSYIKDAKFTSIGNGWYISKNLLLGGHRLDLQYTIPQSLFDFSTSYTPLNLDTEKNSAEITYDIFCTLL